MTAYIFPGQGAQFVGMGKDLYERSPLAKEFFRRADEVLGVDLSRICFEGPEEELRKTKNTQPAIYLHSVILTRLMGRSTADMVAGHSLGEYTALVHAGALPFEEGLKLVRLRGELMQEAGTREKGTMAAIVGLEPAQVEDICRQASAAGIVQCANFNSPGQIVISGSVEGVHKAMEIALQHKASLVKELVVSGAFHSPLMKSAREGLRKAIQTAELEDARLPVYANVTAKGVQKAQEIRTLLEQQLTSPVRWEESVRHMIADGASSFVEIGPGKVLRGLVKRIDGGVQVAGVDKFEEIQTIA
jgi:[acyl-carrier-protein] S-malonyltransferase